ncbi:MAG TPA: tyrosine-type recombinase/integrase [Actinophytocola sp.]|uniref:tyrosine-type recombinase/integrase n=1 Tax=Actinophytocola sp. TaxID=1872138 RepID=UPI002DDD28F3|nr:tyrosine-type recombinase/integrase [Actinophytocola sp.]HEV2783239.1 tyrosine-type recombinase/integrase [Actinophytocola sp.]
MIINEAWRDQDRGALIWIAMTTGARRGELCALRWNDIDFAPGEETMWIGRAIKKGKKGWVEGPTKTHQHRRVALDPETVLILSELLDRVKARAEALGLGLSEDAFVFSSAADHGTFYYPHTLTQRYDRMVKRLKIRTTLHKLRHFSATELIRATQWWRWPRSARCWWPPCRPRPDRGAARVHHPSHVVGGHPRLRSRIGRRALVKRLPICLRNMS